MPLCLRVNMKHLILDLTKKQTKTIWQLIRTKQPEKLTKWEE